MGEQGVATTPDAFPQNWNPSKYSFAPSESGIGVSYTYLSQLVNDIFLECIILQGCFDAQLGRQA